MATAPAVNTEEFSLLRDLIEKECGIVIEDNKVYLIESRLSRLVVESGCNTFGEFYLKAKNNIDSILRDKIVDAITTNETLWFRDESPFTTLSEVILPEFQAELKAGTRKDIRIWSAACSTGQEPYSIAITADQFQKNNRVIELNQKSLSITATDICSSALFLAKNARYDELSMKRGMPENLRSQYFTQNGKVAVLNDEIKQYVSFQKFNIMNPFDSLGKFDIIFVRNVAIYFSADFKANLLEKMALSLKPGGYLFLGSSESFHGYANRFSLKQHGRCLYYQRKS